jgi:hypothetical protein
MRIPYVQLGGLVLQERAVQTYTPVAIDAPYPNQNLDVE